METTRKTLYVDKRREMDPDLIKEILDENTSEKRREEIRTLLNIRATRSNKTIPLDWDKVRDILKKANMSLRATQIAERYRPNPVSDYSLAEKITAQYLKIQPKGIVRYKGRAEITNQPCWRYDYR